LVVDTVVNTDDLMDEDTLLQEIMDAFEDLPSLSQSIIEERHDGR
jgi:hypothetical protein